MVGSDSGSETTLVRCDRYLGVYEDILERILNKDVALVGNNQIKKDSQFNLSEEYLNDHRNLTVLVNDGIDKGKGVDLNNYDKEEVDEQYQEDKIIRAINESRISLFNSHRIGESTDMGSLGVFGGSNIHKDNIYGKAENFDRIDNNQNL